MASSEATVVNAPRGQGLAAADPAGAIDAAQLLALADRPLFAPLAAALDDLARMSSLAVDALDAWAARRSPRPCTAAGRPLRFVPPGAHDGGYEARVHDRGEVETRPDNWHDLFNALVWTSFPRTKAALNALHVEEIAAGRDKAQRGTVRDAATQFDESGMVVLSADPGLFELLRMRRWADLFWHRRDAVMRRMRFLVFGHGLYDALRAPFFGLCGRAALVEVAPTLLDAPVADQVRRADEVLSARFRARACYPRAKAFEPLPVLGIPGVTPDSECLAYYQDRRQFRPLAPAGGRCLPRADS